MKKSTQTVTRLLALLTLLSSLPSCSGSETDTSATENNTAETIETETTEETTFIPDDLEDEDFGGYQFRILSSFLLGKDLANYVTYDELTGEPINDQLYYSRVAVEERFNTKITWTEEGEFYEVDELARKNILGGEDAFDMLINQDTFTFALGPRGMVLNLADIDTFNFDKPWWPRHAVESLSIAGRLYAASSYLSYCGIHWTRLITVNKDYAEDIQMEIPYDVVRDGNWTLDAFYSLVNGNSVDVDGDGTITEKDQVAFTSGEQTLYCLQESCDLPMYRKDENGIPYLDLDIERADYYNEYVKKLFHGEDYVESGYFGEELFKEGDVLFAYTQIGNAYDDFRLGDVRYGFLPAPKLNEAQESYISACTDVPWCMPITLSDEQVHIVSTIIEALSCYNYNNMLPVYFESTLKSRISDSPDDAEMLQIVADTRTLAFAYAYGLPLYNFGTVTHKTGVSSYFTSSEKKAISALETLVENTLEKGH